MIKQAVPPGGDPALHLVGLKLAISPNVGNSDAEFLLVGIAFAHPFDFFLSHRLFKLYNSINLL